MINFIGFPPGTSLWSQFRKSLLFRKMHNHTLPIKLIKSNKVPPLKLGLKNERCFILFAIAINTRLSICSSFFFFFLNKPFWPEIHVSWGNPQIGKRIKITLINNKKKKCRPQNSERWVTRCWRELLLLKLPVWHLRVSGNLSAWFLCEGLPNISLAQVL